MLALTMVPPMHATHHSTDPPPPPFPAHLLHLIFVKNIYLQLGILEHITDLNLCFQVTYIVLKGKGFSEPIKFGFQL